MYEYLYILDYSTPGIYEIKLDENSSKETTDEILDKYNFDQNCCSWMFTNIKLNLQTINETK